jgi:hypothetical protein
LAKHRRYTHQPTFWRRSASLRYRLILPTVEQDAGVG